MNWSGKCEGPGGGDRRGALCTGFTLVTYKTQKNNVQYGDTKEHDSLHNMTTSQIFRPIRCRVLTVGAIMSKINSILLDKLAS